MQVPSGPCLFTRKGVNLAPIRLGYNGRKPLSCTSMLTTLPNNSAEQLCLFLPDVTCSRPLQRPHFLQEWRV